MIAVTIALMPLIINLLFSVAKSCAKLTGSGTIQITVAVTIVMKMIERYQIAESILENIRRVLNVPEKGGILGVAENRVVTEFHHDSTGFTTARFYTPDIENLNRVILEWSHRGIAFIGFVHSHSPNRVTLSSTDVRYAEKIKRCCGMSEILMVLYLPSDSSFYHYVL